MESFSQSLTAGSGLIIGVLSHEGLFEKQIQPLLF